MKALASYVRARIVDDAGCWRWIGSVCNGHPTGTVAGRKLLIRRAMIEAERGTIPPGHIVRCTCETRLCVHPAHLRMTTYREVARECGALGLMSGPVRSARIAATKRAGPQARITQEDARAIRASSESLTVLARRYGVSVGFVSQVRRGAVRREFAGNPWAGLV